MAFTAEADLAAMERFNRQPVPAVPADAVDPGGTLQACDPLYLVDYIAYENMEEGMAVVVRVTVDGETFATTRERWRGRLRKRKLERATSAPATCRTVSPCRMAAGLSRSRSTARSATRRP